MIGIYKIINTINGKVYIGQTNDIERRRNQHFSALQSGQHENKDMQQDFNRWPDAFTFEVVEECFLSMLNTREKYWIDYFKSAEKRYGYNQTAGGGSRKRKYKGRPVSLLDELTN